MSFLYLKFEKTVVFKFVNCVIYKFIFVRADEDNDDVIESYSLYYIFSVFPSFVYYFV